MLATGQHVGRYVVLEFIASGGTSEVYKVCAEGASDRGFFALKLLREDLRGNPVLQARLYNEALGFKDLEVPGLVRVLDHGEHDGRPFIVLEYLAGGSLADKARPLPLPTVLSLGIAIASTLTALHDLGIIHRDVKPHNMLLTAMGEPRLSDLGVAKNDVGKIEGTTIPHSTETGVFLGTRTYAAPEQLINAKAVSPSADVYSLGVVLFELFTGVLPYGSADLDLPWSAAGPRLLLTRLRAAPPPLAALLVRMLAAWPEGRPSAAAVAEELSRIQSLPSHGHRRWPGWPGHVRWMIVAIVLALLPSSHHIDPTRSLDTLYQSFEDDLDRATVAAAQKTLDLAGLVVAERPLPAPALARYGFKVADMARIKGDLAAARRGYEASLEVWRRLTESTGSPDDHRRRAICANELGDILLHLGRSEDALSLYREALIHQQVLLTLEFNQRPQLAYTHYRLGLAYAESGESAEARQELLGAWDLLAGRHDHPDILLYQSRVAERLVVMSDGPAAIDQARRAYELGRQAIGQHPRSKRHRIAYLRVAEQLGDLVHDPVLLKAALEGLRSLWRADPAYAISAHELLEMLLRRLRREPYRDDLKREAHMVLQSMDHLGQWVDDVHVASWRTRLDALESRDARVFPLK